MQLQIPKPIKQGNTIGICTPSTPAYAISEEVFTLGIQNIERRGFKVKLGSLTAKRGAQGYRSGTPQERASELLELFEDKEVKAIVTTIGGTNSNSLIPYLDFKSIEQNPKIFCGYSDITSLHLALMKKSNLATFYGPGVMPNWSEFPFGMEESIQSFFEAIENRERILKPFSKWSNHHRDWTTNDWKEVPRKWNENAGWKVLSKGSVKAPIVICNLNTLMASAGTPFFPDVDGKILLIEEMYAPLSREERSLRQLQLMGVFDRIACLIVGKPEKFEQEGAPFTFEDLLMEIVGKRKYPIITDFDCSHTLPMHTIRQDSLVEIVAQSNWLREVKIS